LTWGAVIFVFFSISRSKLPGYFLPATVPLSILMAQVWAQLDAPTLDRRPDWLAAGFATLVALGLLVSLSPQLLRSHTLQLLVTKRLPPTLTPLVRPALLFAGLLLAGLGVLGRNLSARLRPGALSTLSFAILVLTTPLLIARWFVPLEVYAASASSRRLARTILQSPEKDLPIYGYYYFRSGLPFYLRRPVGLVTQGASELSSNYVVLRWQSVRQAASSSSERVAQSNDGVGLGTAPLTHGSPLLIDASRLPALVDASSSPWLLLLRGDQVGQLAQTLGSVEPLWDGWDYSVWKVQGTGQKTRIYRLR
jgi:4-amino-4-deoxy-L-arabinose transferase-like glycosyltransferase